MGEYAWYFTNSKSDRFLPVGSLRPNGAGLFDMQGNVMEWCQDRALLYGTVLESVEDKEQAENIKNSNGRVLRGGSFIVIAASVRSSNRLFNLPDFLYNFAGFRVSRTYR